MIESSMMINDRMPEYCVERASKLLNKVKRSVNGSKVLILGVAYKQDIDDYRESPAIKVIENFLEEGALVSYHDPYIPVFIHKGKEYNSIDLTAASLQAADLVVITTMHSCFDYSFIQENSKKIFDTKNAMKNVTTRHNIELL